MAWLVVDLPISFATFPLDILSNCSYSFGVGTGAIIDLTNSVMPRSVLGLKPHPSPSLVAVNVGFGSTGTRSVYETNLELYGLGCHWHNCLPGDTKNPLPAHFDMIRTCMKEPENGKNGENPCSTKTWMNKLTEILHSIAGGGIHTLSDDPMPYLFSELRHLLPGVLMQHSVRDPFLWTLKRMSDHPRGDLMCAEHTASPNPFHILECMQGSENVQDNLITVRNFALVDKFAAAEFLSGNMTRINTKMPNAVAKIRAVTEYYVLYNRYIVSHVDHEKYDPICVWDGYHKSQPNFKQQMVQKWAQQVQGAAVGPGRNPRQHHHQHHHTRAHPHQLQPPLQQQQQLQQQKPQPQQSEPRESSNTPKTRPLGGKIKAGAKVKPKGKAKAASAYNLAVTAPL